MTSPLSRRLLVQRGSVLGAAATLGGQRFTFAQDASPAATAVEADADFLAAQDALVESLKEFAGSKIKMLSAVAGGKDPEEDVLFAQEFQRLTGVELELVHPTAEYNQKLQADLTAGVEYDLIYTNKSTMDLFVEQEILTDLTDQISASGVLGNPTVIPAEEWEMITYDGRIYSVFNKFEGSRMITMRQDWLDKLGLETPRTLEEFYDTMVALRDGDPAGDGGQPIGFSATGTYDFQPFFSAWGLRNGYRYTDDGSKVIDYASDEAIPVYEYLAKLFAEGLIDPNFATQDMAAVRNQFMTDKLSSLCYWDTWVGLFNAQMLAADPATEFVAVGVAGIADENDNITITRGQPSVWMIPINAPNPDLAFKILEWWHTFPGITLTSLGILDHDYTVTDGVYALTEVGKQHAMDHGQPTPYNTNWVNPIGENPGLKEAQAITKQYASLDYYGPDWDATIKPLVDAAIIQMILGDVAPADGVAALQEDLRSQGFID
ncbi:MAG: extracellular solute-binding protein [Thermomicrobiales bacterium]|nr:extracellular solute-binding protein [Thermomicrobiales bacterium]